MREAFGYNPEDGHNINHEEFASEEHVDPKDSFGIYDHKEEGALVGSLKDKAATEKLNFKKIVHYLKEADLKIQDKIVEVLNLKDDELENIAFNEDLGYEVGQLAGMKFNQLLLKGLVEVDQIYIHEKEPDLKAFFVKNDVARLHRKKVNSFPTKFNDSKKRFLESYNSESPAVVSEHKFDDHIEQYFRQRVRQEDSDNIIHESVHNDTDGEENHPSSQLRVTNPRTGKILDLNLLLPKGVVFVPASMSYDYIDQKVLQSSSSGELEYYAKDLNQYSGSQNSGPFGFSFSYYARRAEDGRREVRQQEVRYGDITKTGGMLSLLHEITHSWQKQVRSKGGRYDYEAYLHEIKERLNLYARSVQIGSPEIEEKSSEVLKAAGVLVGSDQKGSEETAFLVSKVPVSQDRDFVGGVMLKSETTADVLIKSDKLKEYIESYVEEERNAWSNAIKIIRFLRKQGIDLEPNLKTLSDFREQYEMPLHSYDVGILMDDNIASAGGVRDFKRSRKKT